MRFNLFLTVMLSLCAISGGSLFAGQRGGQDPADRAANEAATAARDAAAARVAEPVDPNKKVDRKKADAQKKADLAEYKGMLKENKEFIKTMFDKAEAAWKAKNYKEAGTFYVSVSQATAPGTEDMVDTSLQRINVDMEKVAQEHLAAANDAGLQRDFLKDIEELTFIVKELEITKTAREAQQNMISLRSKPEVAGFVDYAQAEQLLADNKLTEALAALNVIVNNPRYEHSIPALKAARKLDELNKSDDMRGRIKTEFLAKADNEAPRLLSAAKNYVANNMPKKAKEKLDTVLDKYPGTPYADEAKKQMDELAK